MHFKRRRTIMKKIIFILLTFISLSVPAEIIQMDERNPDSNELFLDKSGHYRYRSGKDIYQKACTDIYVYEIKKKCLEAEEASWKRKKTPEEIAKEGTLFTGKIKLVPKKGKPTYFYVNKGKQGKKIRLLLDQYYFEDGVLHDIETEEPFSGELVIGGVEGLSENKNGPRYIVKQRYEAGNPEGEPVLNSVK